MRVLRIVADIHTVEIAKAKSFYHGILGLDILMDQGWVATYASTAEMPVQITFASEGGSGTRTPNLSIEVDDLDAALKAMHDAKIPIEYGPAEEPWGVRRFYVRDPFNNLLNILQHI